MTRSAILVMALACAGAGCFGNESTPFPPGLEPLEDNTAVAPAPRDGEQYPEAMGMEFGRGPGYDWGHARGWVHAPPERVWEILRDPLVMADRRTADDIWWDLNPEPEYEYGYLLHYFVDEIVNVEWDEIWRFGVIEGVPDRPDFAITRWQKVWGSTFIDLVEGSLIVVRQEDDVTLFEMILHLESVSSDTGNIRESFEDMFESLVARAHGEPLPEW